jgi:hypothetical protein
LNGDGVTPGGIVVSDLLSVKAYMDFAFAPLPYGAMEMNLVMEGGSVSELDGCTKASRSKKNASGDADR